ncbi:uncharacterized protein LOC115265101 [Aedes albopictus]|uniref:Nucleic-acid-binding protein from mobile element jockey n=1 Tax=Aedes albopictus TaxID=7160 RepID=A0ABM1YQX6_AEDAL
MATGGGGGLPPDKGKDQSEIDGNKMADDSAPESFMYTARDAAPYRVYVEIIDNTKRIYKFSVGSVLRKLEKYRNQITELKYLGRNKIIVFSNSWVKANLLVGETVLAEKGYKAYIPRHLVCITGVIGGIPTDIEMEEIEQDYECAYPVVNLYRLNRWDREKGKKVASNRVSVTFRASNLPEKMKVFGSSVKVQPYVRRFVFCNNCHRFGHREESCKSKKRCGKCARIHEEAEDHCPNEVKCLHCRKSDHRTTDPSCPSRQREISIKTMMSKKNLTYVEARELIAPLPIQNQYDVLADIAEFPALPNTFARMTAGRFTTRSNQPQQQRNVTINKPEERQLGAIKKPANDLSGGAKKMKIDEERQHLIKDRNAEGTSRGSGLENRHAVSERERWDNIIKKANADALETANRNVRGELANFYAALIQCSGVTEELQEKIKECSKKYLNLESIIV